MHLIPAMLVALIKAPSKSTYFSDLLMIFPWGVSLAAMERGKKDKRPCVLELRDSMSKVRNK